MWLGVWASRRRGEDKWEAFIKRYFEFHDEDVALLCANHHAEIHARYDVVIQADVVRLGRPLSQYTWAQAELLMDKMEVVFREWMLEETPGIDAKSFGKRRKSRQGKYSAEEWTDISRKRRG